MQTQTVQVWQVDPSDTLEIGGEEFYVESVEDVEDEAIILHGRWTDEGTAAEVSRHPYDEVSVIVSWDED